MWIDPVVVLLPLALLTDQIQLQRDLRLVKSRKLVAAGRAVPQKGFDLLKSALEQLREVNPIDCSIFSERGLSHVRVEPIVGRGHLVRWMPWLPRVELLEAMSRAQAVVIPSRFEPLGLVAAEAMAVGTPVIASGVGGLRDLVTSDREVGVLVEAGSRGPTPVALAYAIAAELNRGPRISQGRARLMDYSYERFLESVTQAAER